MAFDYEWINHEAGWVEAAPKPIIELLKYRDGFRYCAIHSAALCKPAINDEIWIKAA